MSTLLHTILAIDTSCDETAVAVVRRTSDQPTVTTLSNVIASQVNLHQQYGGVFPTVAKQAHLENLDRCVTLALKRAQLSWAEIDAIAVTQGPGLAPALEVGITFAKKYATEHNLPLIPVNHIEGHVVSVLATNRTKQTTITPQFPALSIIISGGHSEFILVTQFGEYQRLGWTIDDAAGEALDKVGRMLNLGYPAGPVIETFAKQGNPHQFEFPLPMTTSGDYNLSFSGLKTFARRLIEQLEASGPMTQQQIFDFCASFQYATFRHICHKLNKILIDQPNLGQVWLGGGVAANIKLRQMIRQTLRLHYKNSTKKTSQQLLPLLVPYTKKLCGDNAAMIGAVALLNPDATPTTSVDRRPQWKIDQK